MAPLRWDIFCKVIDNHGDIGVCWRLSVQLARRGHQVRLWVDNAAALAWMAPQGCPGVSVLPWQPPISGTTGAAAGDVVIEAFGCELDPTFVTTMAAQAAGARAPAWINLEYLSAEPWAEQNHGLLSPVMAGPGAGLQKFFFYPGFTPATGGLLREPELPAQQARFDRRAWLQSQGVALQAGQLVVSLFCYEPPLLADLLHDLAGSAPAHLLVTAGRAAAAVRAALASPPLITATPALHWLPALPQTHYDHLLWACDLNFVRGEDSLVRALWAGKPFVWHIYPQDDGAHHAKLEAFLDWLDAPASLRQFSRAWNSLPGTSALLTLSPQVVEDWAACCAKARDRLLTQADLCEQLENFVALRALPRHLSNPNPP